MKPVDVYINRFWTKVEKSHSCWNWKACKSKKGYGQFWSGEQSILAHRFSYEIKNGPIKQGLLVCHHCDNPSCVNPSHLFAGTSNDNIADKMKKGRAWACSGEDNPNAKLTNNQVVEIRRLYKAGGYSQRKLAKKFKISQNNVYKILKNKTRNGAN